MKVPFRISTLSDGRWERIGCLCSLEYLGSGGDYSPPRIPGPGRSPSQQRGPRSTARSATRREGDGSGHPDHGVLSAKEGARYRGCADAPTPRPVGQRSGTAAPAPAGQGPRSALPHAGKTPSKQTQRGRSNPGRRIFQNASQALIRAWPGGDAPMHRGRGEGGQHGLLLRE